MRRRGSFNKVSAQVIQMLIDRYGMTQTQIAGILGVDKSFVSRVKSAERDLSPDQLEALSDAIRLPVGAMLIKIHDGKTPARPEYAPIIEKINALLRRFDEFDAMRKAEEDPHTANRMRNPDHLKDAG